MQLQGGPGQERGRGGSISCQVMRRMQMQLGQGGGKNRAAQPHVGRLPHIATIVHTPTWEWNLPVQLYPLGPNGSNPAQQRAQEKGKSSVAAVTARQYSMPACLPATHSRGGRMQTNSRLLDQPPWQQESTQELPTLQS